MAIHSNLGQSHFLPWKPEVRPVTSEKQDIQITTPMLLGYHSIIKGFIPLKVWVTVQPSGLSLALRICGFKFFYLIVMSHLGNFPLLFLELLSGSLS